ncbi:MAG: VanW family protein [Candidatus Microgenomates bacterium]|jgi:vancomycin resistance protein YoaR
MTRHPKSKKFSKKIYLYIAIALFISVILIAGSLIFYIADFSEKVYPNITVAGINIGGLNLNSSAYKISKNLSTPDEVVLTYQDKQFKIKTSDINFNYDFESSTLNAYNYTRTGNFWSDLLVRINLLIYPKDLGLITNIDEGKLNKFISSVSDQVSVKPVDPSLNLANSKVVISRGSPGTEVNKYLLNIKIHEALSLDKSTNIEIPVEIVNSSLTQAEVDSLQNRAEEFIGKGLTMNFEFNSFTLKDSDIVSLLDFESGYSESSISALIQKIDNSVNRNSQNPKFVFDNDRVSEFQPALDGIKVDDTRFKDLLTNSLDSLASGDEKTLSFDIPVARTSPEVSTSEVNNLGIKELIGRGTSTYYGSISSRIHNIVLAATKINGTLVKPGQTFSFNETLGDVSQFTGYQQAYIISEGKTILGDGGGVCQVSTTLFRALLNAGLPITERQAHAYRVGYYEQDSPPGLDATVYSPSPDLQFVNNTPAYILIEAAANPKNYSLIFELYGTSDGRVATISKSVVTDITAPPPDLYQDDPTLPAGTIKQTDFKAWGAKVTFNYSVNRDGKEIYSKTFVSNYQPWQAIYLRGTGPAQ